MLAVLLALAPANPPAAALVERPPPRIAVEAAVATIFRDDPRGGLEALEDPEMAFGARAWIDLSGLMPEPLRLDAGLLWYGSGRVEGTAAVQVDRDLDTFALPVRAGWDFGWRPGGLALIPYLTAGPAATLASVDYRVADPVGLERGVRPSETGVSGWAFGGLFGAGIGFDLPLGEVAFVGRLELEATSRGPHLDHGLSLGFGVAL